MNKIYGQLFIILAIFSLSSCASRFIIHSDIAEQLSHIKINAPADSIASYEFTSHLRSILNTKDDNAKYKLVLAFAGASSIIAVQNDTDSIRDSIEVVVTYQLYDLTGIKLLYSGKFRQVNSYNTIFSPFSTNIEAVQAYSNLYKASAEELRRRLILYFRAQIKD